MSYEYGLPHAVTLESGEYFPADETDPGLYEILGFVGNQESGHTPLFVAVPIPPGVTFDPPDDLEEGEEPPEPPTEYRCHTRAGMAGQQFFASGCCRFTVAGSTGDRVILWVRSVNGAELPTADYPAGGDVFGEADPPEGDGPTEIPRRTGRTRRATSEETGESDP